MGQDFLVKMGGGVIHTGKLSIEGGKDFSLIMDRFWSNNALYLGSLSFIKFIFLAAPFDT